tara:strand:+ start:614 stop:2143 length:1530 start_codon:yes stop_codon:yes gene_type:complete
MGCATTSTDDESGYAHLIEEDSEFDGEFKGLSEESARALAQKILLAESQIGDESEPEISESIKEVEKEKREPEKKELVQGPKIPIEINRRVYQWIRYFTQKDPARFKRFLVRGEKYRPQIEAILKKHGLPKELYYLGLIESGYQTKAISRVGATGPWQFMRLTARDFGLRVGYFADERRDPLRATEAAAKYLKYLYQTFQSWHLAMAAYNAGQGRIARAIKRGRTKSYWRLARRRKIPKETIHYVPKFFAAVIIGKNPKEFGLGEIERNPIPQAELVSLPSPLRLRDLARQTSTSLEDLKELNPHLTHAVTPPQLRNYSVWIPKERVAVVSQKVSHLKKYRARGVRKPRTYGRARRVIVRRGDTLGRIARRNRTSVRRLKKLNSLRGSHIQAGQRLIVGYRSQRGIFYRVRRGDTLSEISKKMGVSVSSLKRWNRIRGSSIYPGQKIRLTQAKTRRVASTSKRKKRVYRVRKGDSLYAIAKRFGVTVAQIKKRNQIRKSDIYAGQLLRL